MQVFCRNGGRKFGHVHAELGAERAAERAKHFSSHSAQEFRTWLGLAKEFNL